jgi:hypothetical protein
MTNQIQAIEVRLTPSELLIGAQVAVMRRIKSISRGGTEKHGLNRDPWDANINGALGEIAAAKALGRYWDASVDVFGRADLPANELFGLDGIQIRTMGKGYFDLLVRPSDTDSDVFILVTSEQSPVFLVHGWTTGAEAKQQRWLDAKGGRVAAYFVPQSHLKPICDLKCHHNEMVTYGTSPQH